MNKQELIERIDKLPYVEGPIADTVTVNRSWILESIEQLDEPQKVTVPQFVADWIERSKQENRNLRNALNNGGEKMRWWFLSQENYDLFGRAWLDGYEVEEKRYLVKIIGITNYNSYLNYHKGENKWTIESRMEIDAIRTEHTRKELEEAGFGWVFDCTGIEIEEVE